MMQLRVLRITHMRSRDVILLKSRAVNISQTIYNSQLVNPTMTRTHRILHTGNSAPHTRVAHCIGSRSLHILDRGYTSDRLPHAAHTASCMSKRGACKSVKIRKAKGMVVAFPWILGFRLSIMLSVAYMLAWRV
jgi:hypothetical protein